jgi:hypothetical protein
MEADAMATFNKFQITAQNLGRGVHNLHTDTLKLLLANTAPVNTNQVKADLTEISAGNGYAAGGPSVANTSYTQTAGVGKLAGDDRVITASGGTIGPFRYVALYDDTPTSPADPLLGWWDYGSSITLQDGETFTVDFSDNGQLISLT